MRLLIALALVLAMRAAVANDWRLMGFAALLALAAVVWRENRTSERAAKEKR